MSFLPYEKLLPAACCGLFAVVCMALGSAPAWAGPATQPLELPDSAAEVQGWPAVSVLADPSATWDVHAVLGRMAQFRPPHSPYANLGRGGFGAIWLHLSISVPAGQHGRRVMQIDSAPLEKVNLYVVSDAQVVQHALMGNAVPFSQRPLPSLAHAVELSLQPGHVYDLLLCVQATKNILPIAFFTPESFLSAESHEQMVEGVIAGVGLCLLVYSFAQWLALRESLYFFYGVYVLGVGMFASAYFGLGTQHLWTDNLWLSAHVPSLLVSAYLFGLIGFTEKILAIAQWNVVVSTILSAMRYLMLVNTAIYALDWVDYATASDLMSILSPIVMGLSMFAALTRARRGDRAAKIMLAGWVVYAIGVAVFIGTFQGFLPATYWTQRAVQWVAPLEMGMWMLVLAVRMKEIRSAAHKALAESSTLHSLAHTDALTGLPNRRGLHDILHREAARAGLERLLAVYLLDLDGFKTINDRLGHDAGDQLLVAVSLRLKSLLRSSDRIARLGGDEFVVVARAMPTDAEARRLGHKLLEGMRAPFDIAGERCEVGLTIGYALAPLDADAPQALLGLADAAMYNGKKAGRHCLCRSGPEGAHV